MHSLVKCLPVNNQQRWIRLKRKMQERQAIQNQLKKGWPSKAIYYCKNGISIANRTEITCSKEYVKRNAGKNT